MKMLSPYSVHHGNIFPFLKSVGKRKSKTTKHFCMDTNATCYFIRLHTVVDFTSIYCLLV